MTGTLMNVDLNKYVLLNESFSWTSDLIKILKDDRTVLDKIFKGDRNILKDFFDNHKIKMKNFNAFNGKYKDKDLEIIVRKMSEGGIIILTLFDDDYPSRLRNIHDPPLVLYHIGSIFDMSRCVAISGTRKPVPSIGEMTFDLAAALARNGFIVASGLAHGIDTFAHSGALSIEDGSSIAVMANGLDRVVPCDNLELAKNIASRGAVLSEKTLKPEPSRYDFIRRNRIISGISGVQIIMQSSGFGGTEQQFRIAKGQGRPILVYIGEDLPEISRRRAMSMISNGAKGFISIQEVIDQVTEMFQKEVSSAAGKDVPLDQWA